MDRVVAGVRVRSDGCKADAPAAVAVLVGVACVIVSFWTRGWARLCLQILGGLLSLPLIAFIGLVVLGGAISGLTKPTPSFVQRTALGTLAVAVGIWVGSSIPGAPQELIVTPAGFVASLYLMRGGRIGQPGARRRAAGVLALVALAAGATGLWLLVTA